MNNYQHLVGANVVVLHDEILGNYWSGTILAIDDDTARVKLANDSVFRTTTNRLFVVQSATHFTPQTNELFETEPEWKARLDRREETLADREHKIADREEKIDYLEGEIETLKQRNDTLKGQRDMCFKRLRKAEGDDD